MTVTSGFNPDRVAHFEAAGWRAYYDRNWLRLLRFLLAVCHEQFRIPFPRSLLAAYYVTRAAAAWAPLDHDEQKVLRYYRKFYRAARPYSDLRFDPDVVAALEVRYNDDHRRLTGNPDKSAFLETLIQLHCALFSISREQARESAELRLHAANLVDGITSKTTTDPEGDWVRLEADLRECYRSVARARATASPGRSDLDESAPTR